MKRVQVILEEWQHTWLQEEADRVSSTTSALLRQLLTEMIERRQAINLSDDPLWGIIGMADGPDDGITSANLDEYLYTSHWQNKTLRLAAEAPIATDGIYDQTSAGDR